MHKWGYITLPVGERYAAEIYSQNLTAARKLNEDSFCNEEPLQET